MMFSTALILVLLVNLIWDCFILSLITLKTKINLPINVKKHTLIKGSGAFATQDKVAGYIIGQYVGKVHPQRSVNDKEQLNKDTLYSCNNAFTSLDHELLANMSCRCILWSRKKYDLPQNVFNTDDPSLDQLLIDSRLKGNKKRFINFSKDHDNVIFLPMLLVTLDEKDALFIHWRLQHF